MLLYYINYKNKFKYIKCNIKQNASDLELFLFIYKSHSVCSILYLTISSRCFSLSPVSMAE